MENKLLSKCKALYEENGVNFIEVFCWHLVNGLVLSDNRYFALAFPSYASDPDTLVDFDKANCISVAMFAGDIRKALTSQANRFKFISFQRPYKNSPHVRVYEFDKFLNKSK